MQNKPVLGACQPPQGDAAAPNDLTGTAPAGTGKPRRRSPGEADREHFDQAEEAERQEDA